MAAIKSERCHYDDVAVDSSYLKAKLERSDSLGPMDYVLPSPRPYEDSKLSCSGKDDWLNLALSKLHADQENLDLLERKGKDTKPRASKPKQPRGARPKHPSTAARSRGSYSKPARQSLCATHPTQYAMPVPPAQTLPSKTSMSSAHVTHYRPPQAHNLPPRPSPCYQVYSDPKRLAGYGEPALPDASPRMLKTDTQSAQANIVSPMFLIPMPFGSLVEMAAVYGP